MLQATRLSSRQSSRQQSYRVNVDVSPASEFLPAPSSDSKGLHIVTIGGKNWLTKIEPPEAAVAHLEGLYQSLLHMLLQSSDFGDCLGMFEAAQLLLQWYRSRYLRLSKPVYMRVVATFCALPNPIFAADATHTLYKLCVQQDMLLPDLWLKDATPLNHLIVALRHSNASTVAKCAAILEQVLHAAEDRPSTNLFVLLNPVSITTLHTAFFKWSHSYETSNSLERACTSLYCMQLRNKKPKPMHSRRHSATSLLALWASQLSTAITNPSASASALKASFDSRFSQRGSLSRGATRGDSKHSRGSVASTASVPVPKRHLRAVAKAAIVARVPSPLQVAEASSQSMTSHALLRQFSESSRKSSLKRVPSQRTIKTGKKDADLVQFVTSEIMIEIQRRRSIRRQFEVLLDTALNKYGSPDQTTDARPSGTNMMKSYSQLLQLYLDAQDCAMHDYVETGLEPRHRVYFLESVQPFMDDLQKRCYWAADAPCTKGDWGTCGFGWLRGMSFGLVWTIWASLGGYQFRSESLASIFRFDTEVIHDPLAQAQTGIAIALSQRKSSSRRRVRLQRLLKLGGLWAEWPAFTYTPLAIAFNAMSIGHDINPLLFTLNLYNEILNLIAVIVCGACILFLRHWKQGHKNELLLRRFGYPIVFDVFYIPFISTFARLATCPSGYLHLSLPGGATCDCIDRFGIFWAIGISGFLLLYGSALRYKMYIEPTGTTMDFRFQTSFQIIMVITRTPPEALMTVLVNPILSMLANDMIASGSRVVAIPIALIFLASVLFLLTYSYKAQPCIGSGRVPNNIRVLTFSSSTYTTFAVALVLIFDAPPNALYYLLLPLPGVWAAAWTLNHRRASLFYVPDLSIVELLHQRSKQAKVVGAIAALHMDAARVRRIDHEAIVAQLLKIAKRSRSDELLCRTYAIRFLWFCHIENFRKTKKAVGEISDETAISPKLWCKDRDNSFRATLVKEKSKRTLTTDASLDATKHRVKIHRITTISDVALDTPMNDAADDALPTIWLRCLAHLRREPILASSYRVTSKLEPSDNYHVVRIRDKNWVSRNEAPEAAHFHLVSLYHMALEALAQSCASGDRFAMQHIAVFLLEWYRSRYLRLNRTIYAHVLSALCTTRNSKLVIDATHSLYKATIDGVVPLELWLKNASYLNHFVLALGNESPITVFKCAHLLAKVLVVAERDVKTNLFVLVTPESITTIHGAFDKWHDDYGISETLERVCSSLYTIEVQMQSGYWNIKKSCTVGRPATRNVCEHYESIRRIGADGRLNTPHKQLT
ncbi:hypothetical protein ACHHYP_02823 [Achlya hypogyna]|uniref:Uncharacterized protein n=1 Tax=Achlya hypogyna TaxID=1202772 RepID=A0A1V9ZRW3_ACHHY|nr:hypothetical protein ACHHYP_02823 [Achlya hypogyna]